MKLGVAAGDVIENAGEPLRDRSTGATVKTSLPDVYPGHGSGRWASRGGWWSMGSTPGPPSSSRAKTLGMTVVSQLRKDAALRRCLGRGCRGG